MSSLYQVSTRFGLLFYISWKLTALNWCPPCRGSGEFLLITGRALWCVCACLSLLYTLERCRKSSNIWGLPLREMVDDGIIFNFRLVSIPDMRMIWSWHRLPRSWPVYGACGTTMWCWPTHPGNGEYAFLSSL